MIVRKHQFIALAVLGFCLSPLFSCAPPSSGIQSYAPVTAQAPGTARVWFLRTRDPQEEFGDPIIYANGNQVGRSIPGIAFYRDFPPGTYAFSVQSYGLTAGRPIMKDTVQLTPGSQTYLEILSGDFVGRQLARRSTRRCDLLRANIAAGVGSGLSPYVDRQGSAPRLVAAVLCACGASPRCSGSPCG